MFTLSWTIQTWITFSYFIRFVLAKFVIIGAIIFTEIVLFLPKPEDTSNLIVQPIMPQKTQQ